MFEEIKKCRICGCEDLKTILDLRQQKLTGVFPTLETHDDVEDAPLELVKCMRGCGLVQLRHSCDLSSMYGMNYGYRSGLNSSMVQHLTEITAEIKRNIHITKGDIILDIGSNDGTTLKSYGLEDVRLVGMDPTAAKFRQYYPDNVMVVEDYYSADKFRLLFGEDKAKVITSIAMFYDLESPVDFACSIADILADDGVWVFEQSYLPFMIDTMSFDTVCQEHLEYYYKKKHFHVIDKIYYRLFLYTLL